MKRKIVNYLINKRMQLAFTARFLIVTILFAVFIGFLGYVTLWPIFLAYVPKNLIDLAKHQVFIRTILFLIPAVFVIIGFTIVVSHRFAGPLNRLVRTIDDVIQGKDVENIRLRKKDEPELKILSAKLNDLIALVKKLREPTKIDNLPPK